jgi:LPXTG-motif cell wall-anchored protein
MERARRSTAERGAKRGNEEAPVSRPVRSIWSVAVAGMLGALFAFPVLASGAGAQTTSVCTFTASETAPGTIAVSVTTPAGATEVRVTFTPDDASSPPQVESRTPPAGGGVTTLQLTAAGAGVVTANFFDADGSAYGTGCSAPDGNAGISISRDPTDPTEAPAAQARALAFTGSHGTPSYVLVGVAAVVIGLVFVVAARRRRQV